MTGLIVKGIAGFYYVKYEDKVYQCKARGIFKRRGNKLCVGDTVGFEVLDDGDGIINTVEPRKNVFIRPPIANVDTFVVTVAVKDPKPNTLIIDRFLVMAEMNNSEVILCINKADLGTEKEILELKKIYDKMYDVVVISGTKEDNMEVLVEKLVNKKIAFAGPSGVGKSTIINLLQSDINMEIGAISTKTNRGKHTTRHVEIFQLDSGVMVFDTPGFTSFDVLDAKEENLQFYFPEFQDYIGKCKYKGCRHLKEPKCAVLNAVEDGNIHPSRYHSYKYFMEEIQNQRKY